ncbi:hypothetical protein E2C01_081678 [Portunus trituberculatus]|uniref:Uncharacterized protein n=1 Tax=Portunus trituberculatus TaxID=210409 RepID=A0A5B7ISI1_PORTR|nr:hypothetical protein [Portunus trituberculatus]
MRAARRVCVRVRVADGSHRAVSAQLAWQREGGMPCLPVRVRKEEGRRLQEVSESRCVQTLTLFIAQIDEMSPVTLTKGRAGPGWGVGGALPLEGRGVPGRGGAGRADQVLQHKARGGRAAPRRRQTNPCRAAGAARRQLRPRRVKQKYKIQLSLASAATTVTTAAAAAAASPWRLTVVLVAPRRAQQQAERGWARPR